MQEVFANQSVEEGRVWGRHEKLLAPELFLDHVKKTSEADYARI